MVNTGKPSPGCGTCRARRIKCDERKPTCFCCQKSKRVCTGYRDPAFISGLRRKRIVIPFVETYIASKSTPVFAVQLFNEKHYSPNYTSVSPNDYDIQHIAFSSAYCLSNPIDDQAFCYFLKHFVLSPRKGNSRSYLSFVIPVMEKEKASVMEKPSTLSSAVKAVSLALLSNRPGSRSLQSRVVRQYSKALKEVNHALKSPELVLKDETLAAVLILGLFEALSTNGQPKGWFSHANGAAMLVKARDEKGESSDLGRVLHVMVRSQVVINCFLCCKEPPLGVEWWMGFGTKDGIPSTSAELCLEAVSIHAQIHAILVSATHSIDDLETALNLLKTAQKLDAKFNEWEATLPPTWRSYTLAWCEGNGETLKKAKLFPGKIDKYIDISIATARNIARASKIGLIGDIVRVRAWLCPSYQDYKTTSEYLTSVRTVRQSIEDIIASIPYFLGELPMTEASSPVAEGLFGTSSLAMFITWPLFVIASSDVASAQQREWVAGRLNFIAEEKGVGQASLFAELNVRIPSMSIYRDKISKIEGKDAARTKCLEFAALKCGGGVRKKQAMDIIKGILGLTDDVNTIPAGTASPKAKSTRPVRENWFQSTGLDPQALYPSHSHQQANINTRIQLRV